MALDPSIPFRAGTAGAVNLSDLLNQHQQRQMNERTMQQRDRQMDMQEQQFEFEMQQHTARLDAAQREAAAKGLEDIAAAVQWAQTPEQWAVVQQHYGRLDPQLATVPFEQREQVLVTTGRMKDYLEATAPKIQSIEAGGSLAAVDPRTGRPTFTVLPNPGGIEPGAPAGGEERKSVGGRNFVKRNGQWFEETGGSNAAGNFPVQ